MILCSWVIAGAPRRIASLRLSGLPASAVPNSLIRSAKRCLNGSRSVFWTRSFWTVWETCDAGIVPPSSSGGPAGVAGDVVLGDQRLRLGRALGVLAERAELARELDGHAGLLLRGDRELGDRAGVDACDPHVRALDDPERVVHLDLVACGCRRRRRSSARPADGGDDQDSDATVAIRLMARLHVWSGSHSPGRPSVSAPPSVNGTESSDGSRSLTGRSLPPGQRRSGRWSSDCELLLGGERLEQVRQAARQPRR